MESLKRPFKPAVLAGVLVIGIALALYVSTLDTGLRLEELHGGDLVTHQYAQVQARPSNAPGYPLYTMGGWLWFHMGRELLSPLFNPTAILSLYSTLWGALSLLVLYILLREVTDDNWPVAALMTLFYAFTYFFWYYSCSTEQYTSAVFQTLLMVLWAFRWERTRADKYLYLLAFMTGLCLANLVTVLFLLPPLLVLIVTGRPRVLRQPKLIGACVVLALVPLLSYVYVYVRGAQHPEWWGAGEWRSAGEWFVSFISTQQGRDEMTWTLGPLTAEFPGLIFWDMSVIGVLLALWGWWLLGRRRGAFLFGVLALYLLFSYIDRFGNWYQVFMPVYPLLVVGMAVAFNRVWRWMDGRKRELWWRLALLIAMGALVASRLTYPDPRAFQRNRPDDDGLSLGWALLSDWPTQGATIIGDADQFVSLEYLTKIWGVRSDVRAAQLNEAPGLISHQQPDLYFTRQVSPLVMQEAGVTLYPAGHGAELVALRSAPLLELPHSAHAVDIVIGDSLWLVGYQFVQAESSPPWYVPAEEPVGKFHLTLYWRANEGMDRDWSISVRPTWHGQLLPAGAGIVQMDVVHPVLGLYPMSAWTTGEIVRDDYVIPVRADQKFDGAQIVVYGAVGDGFENLGVVDLPLAYP